MSRHLLSTAGLCIGLLTGLPAGAWAKEPQVVTDIAPVHGLVARVMDGVGTPELLVPPGASPHGYAMKPSRAGALADADVVFMVGAGLTPWLIKPVETLAPDVPHVSLLDAPGTTLLANRTGATFERHQHGADEGGDHPHDEGHDHAHDHDHDHDHDGTDPHAWLDPENGKVWLAAIAAELSKIDPDHAATYAANATAGAAEIDAASAEVRGELAAVPDLRFIVFHDAYQYFEDRFGVTAAGSISISDATPPGPARVSELRAKVAELKIDCAFTEPQFNPDLLRTIFDGANAKTAVIDPLGTEIPEGRDFYPALIRSVGASLASCR